MIMLRKIIAIMSVFVFAFGIGAATLIVEVRAAGGRLEMLAPYYDTIDFMINGDDNTIFGISDNQITNIPYSSRLFELLRLSQSGNYREDHIRNIVKSNNGGKTWEDIFIENDTEIITHVVFYDNGVLYIGTSNGVYKIQGNDHSVEMMNTGLYTLKLEKDPLSGMLVNVPKARQIYNFLSDGKNLWTNTSGKLFKCSINKESWKEVSVNSKQTYAEDIEYYKGYIYVSTADGVYRTNDSDAGWSAVNDGLTSVNENYSSYTLEIIGESLYAYKMIDSKVQRFKISDDGTKWNISEIMNTSAVEYSRKVSDGSNLYYIFNKSVFMSSDNGMTWKEAAKTGLTDEIVRDYVWSGGKLIMATNNGVYSFALSETPAKTDNGNASADGGLSAARPGWVTVADKSGNKPEEYDVSSLKAQNGAIEIAAKAVSDTYLWKANLFDINELNKANNAGVLRLSGGSVSFSLPLGIAKEINGLTDYMKAKALEPKDVFIGVSVEKLDGSENSKAEADYGKSYADGKIVSGFYEIALALYNTNGQKLDFGIGGPTPLRTFTVNTDGASNAVFNYDKATGRFSFAAAKFTVGKANVLAAGDGIYVAVQNNTAFGDVKDGQWYKPDVTAAANKGLVSGVGNGLFDPGRQVTRADFVQMIANALQLSKIDTALKKYTDVADNAWYYNAVMRAKTAGYLNKLTAQETGFGKQAEEFFPNQPITRGEMAGVAAAALRASNISLKTIENNIKEVFSDLGEKNAEDVALVYGLKIMQGMGDGTFGYDSVTTRAQAATVQMNLLKALGFIDE